MADYAREVRKLLGEYGWSLKRRGKGDHEIWHKPGFGRSVTVDSDIRSRHTANQILKDAEIPHKF